MTEEYDYAYCIEEMPRPGLDEPWHWYVSNYEAIRHALKLAEKVTGEPSDSMWESGYSAGDGDTAAKAIFKAMITQAQKEIDDE